MEKTTESTARKIAASRQINVSETKVFDNGSMEVKVKDSVIFHAGKGGRAFWWIKGTYYNPNHRDEDGNLVKQYGYIGDLILQAAGITRE